MVFFLKKYFEGKLFEYYKTLKTNKFINSCLLIYSYNEGVKIMGQNIYTNFDLNDEV